MPLLEVKLENLRELDFGKVDVAFQRHLQRVIEDCVDRPGDATARKVLLQFDLIPATDQSGSVDHVNMTCHIKSTVPPHRSATFQCAPRKGKAGRSMLIFNSATEDVAQGTFDELEKGADHDD